MRLNIKTKYFQYELFFLLLMLTPIIDTINGFMLQGEETTNLSLGTLYRTIILCCIMYKCLKIKSFFTCGVILLYFPIVGAIRGIEEGELVGCLTYAIKWIFPILLILYLYKNVCDCEKTQIWLKKCFDFWSWYVPVSLIIEYILDLGVATYHTVGFKGLYYSTNDIAFVLISVYIYSLYDLLFINVNIKNLIKCILIFAGIIILSTKSSIIFSILILVYFLIRITKITRTKKVGVGLISLGIIAVVYYLNENFISAIIDRYVFMWESSFRNNLLEQALIFATSGRIERISLFFLQLCDSQAPVISILFGWIIPDNVHVIEMDWIDLITQYGVTGFGIELMIYCYFIKIALRYPVRPYWEGVIIGLIYSLLAGHVISGALSGTVFASMFSLLLCSSYIYRNG